MRPKLAFIVGYGALPLPALRRALEKEARELGFEWAAVGDRVCGEIADFVRRADAIFVYSYDLPPEIEEALKSHGGKVVAPCDNYAHLSNVPSEILAKADALYKTGGESNFRKLARLMARLAGMEVEVGEVEEVPWHGIYHPEVGLFEDLREYLERYPYSGRPLVGILFPRSYWLYGQLEPISLLIEALEAEGLGVVPVFTYGYRSRVSRVGLTKEDAIREFFFLDGKPAIEALVNLYFFFLLDHGTVARTEFEIASGVELLRRLGVPIVQVVTSFYRTVEEWARDDRGVDYLSQVYCVIMPEVDGLIEPIYAIGARVDPLGVKEYMPYREHLPYIARRVKRWIELRRKPPGERKIAIVLINPPCKGLEANVAVGLGLDVPESVVRLLRELKRRGYDVGDEIPESGEELVRAIMEKRAISEFRWTSIEEVVERGGAAALVDADTYLRWFEELPPRVRERMVEEWGDPRDVLAGRAPKELAGMVYEGKFVVPGLLFGNVFIAPQPKFGCAGPACDGRVCKVLHDPTIPPPHQWLAVYRWITRVFGADVVVHFGTHGYLEFRPGKGVGLSPECWPEITIDDVPHLYVYVVSNPMEGVIAKRRGYAALVDHVYPPMAMADVLDELDDLLNQYARAKRLGESARARVVCEKLVEAAKRHNIPLPEGAGPDEVAEAVHRYVDMVRGSQVDMGLHVLGNPPREPRKLAEYVVAAMSYDTHYSPSLVRVLAEYLGLDYDKLRERPLEVSEPLGIPNREVLGKLREIAVRVLERLISLNSTEPGLVLEVVEEEVRRILG